MTSTRRPTGSTAGTLDFFMTEAEHLQLDTDQTGLCVYCGAEAEDCEPDTRARRCAQFACLRHGVYGVDALLEDERIEITPGRGWRKGR